MKTLSLITLAAISSMAFAKEIPVTGVSFQKIQILDKFISEGASIGDINADGHPDIVSGSLW